MLNVTIDKLSFAVVLLALISIVFIIEGMRNTNDGYAYISVGIIMLFIAVLLLGYLIGGVVCPA